MAYLQQDRPRHTFSDLSCTPSVPNYSLLWLHKSNFFEQVYRKMYQHLENQNNLFSFSMKYILIQDLFECIDVNIFEKNQVKVKEVDLRRPM